MNSSECKCTTERHSVMVKSTRNLTSKSFIGLALGLQNDTTCIVFPYLAELFLNLVRIPCKILAFEISALSYFLFKSMSTWVIPINVFKSSNSVVAEW